MPISFRRSVFAGAGPLVPALLLCLLSLTASQAIGQEEENQHLGLQKQLNRIDFYIGAAGILNDTISGTEQRDANTTHTVLSIRPSNTVGELFTLRYTAKPWVGFEFNYGNFRNAQNYTFTPVPNPSLLTGGAQTSVHEETLGYVAHLKYHPFGIQPYLGAGGGTLHFIPTPNGGEGLPFQYRAVYYYNVGFEDNFPNSHFGVRAGFRQLIYLDPDFQQNYLTITRRERTSEPTFGFFLRF